ncbi:DNA repair protein [Candidatus Saccharibacteria bacterium]|nr:DNA repair protein [Candidatus Saccharibacteria bacterium]
MRTYFCIDLKSFYASVECVERGLDPMKTDLVVADASRTDKTICLAVSPSLKKKGVKNRCRLFEIPLNLRKTTIIAPPRMQKYLDYAGEIYGIYLNYLSKEDIYVYSIDEVFIDATDYLKYYQKTPREFAKFLMDEIYQKLGVRATAGIGINLYLAKVALDILAKHADDYIGEVDEETFQKQLWDHRPLTDFWRIGPGTARTLERHSIPTMRGIALADEDILYKLFGVDAELLIDHAWGREPVTLADIKNYHSKSKSFSSGQVLYRDYTPTEASLIVREMTREVCLRLVREHQTTPSITLFLGYSNKYKRALSGDENASALRRGYTVPSSSGTANFSCFTNDEAVIMSKIEELYQQIVEPGLDIRRIYLNINHLRAESSLQQLSLFDQPDSKTKRVSKTILELKDRFGKNAIFRGEDLEQHATTLVRNSQIGGHSASAKSYKSVMTGVEDES